MVRLLVVGVQLRCRCRWVCVRLNDKVECLLLLLILVWWWWWWMVVVMSWVVVLVSWWV